MSDNGHKPAEEAPNDGSHAQHPSERDYVRVWAILVVLLVVSVAGPFLEIGVVTRVAAFGIAGVKAFLVAKHFMHLNVEAPIVRYMLVLALALMTVLFAGTAPDVKKHEGLNWENRSAKEHIERALEKQGASE